VKWTGSIPLEDKASHVCEVDLGRYGTEEGLISRGSRQVVVEAINFRAADRGLQQDMVRKFDRLGRVLLVPGDSAGVLGGKIRMAVLREGRMLQCD
jgi:hypothetical protein